MENVKQFEKYEIGTDGKTKAVNFTPSMVFPSEKSVGFIKNGKTEMLIIGESNKTLLRLEEAVETDEVKALGEFNAKTIRKQLAALRKKSAPKEKTEAEK
jgi:hypothetical protein